MNITGPRIVGGIAVLFVMATAIGYYIWLGDKYDQALRAMVEQYNQTVIRKDKTALLELLEQHLDDESQMQLHISMQSVYSNGQLVPDTRTYDKERFIAMVEYTLGKFSDYWFEGQYHEFDRDRSNALIEAKARADVQFPIHGSDVPFQYLTSMQCNAVVTFDTLKEGKLRPRILVLKCNVPLKLETKADMDNLKKMMMEKSQPLGF